MMVDDWIEDLAWRLVEADKRSKSRWKSCANCGDCYTLQEFEALPFASRLETPNGCDPRGGMGGLYFKRCKTPQCSGILADDAIVMAMAGVG